MVIVMGERKEKVALLEVKAKQSDTEPRRRTTWPVSAGAWELPGLVSSHPQPNQTLDLFTLATKKSLWSHPNPYG
jgi:hypothetical protein